MQLFKTKCLLLVLTILLNTPSECYSFKSLEKKKWNFIKNVLFSEQLNATVLSEDDFEEKYKLINDLLKKDEKKT